MLNLQNHHRLQRLHLDDLPVSGLVLQGHEESPLRFLELKNLVLSHDSLVKVCGSLSSCSGLEQLWLRRLSCSDQSGSCLPVLDLQNCHRLTTIHLTDLSVVGSLPPRMHQSISWYFTNVTISAESWRRFIEDLAHSSSDKVFRVVLESCNIDSDTRHLITSCPQFMVK